MTAAISSHTPFVVAAGLFALALRPVGWGATIVTMTVGAAGAVAHADQVRVAQRAAWLAVVAAGVAPFVIVRLQQDIPPIRTTSIGLAASVAAAVAEELFFRRLVYARLERWGPVAAVVASGALFATVHVPAYGLLALPVDLAAGLVFGWQRWASGTWTAPAATHVAANLLQALR